MILTILVIIQLIEKSYISNMKLYELISDRINEFESICKEHKVSSLYAFGSSTRDDFNENSSDIDLLIDIDTNDPLEKGENLLQIWDRLELFFQRKVDLLTYISIKNQVLKKNIDSSKVLIYDGKKQEVSV